MFLESPDWQISSISRRFHYQSRLLTFPSVQGKIESEKRKLVGKLVSMGRCHEERRKCRKNVVGDFF
jgi:hypothetical protein